MTEVIAIGRTHYYTVRKGAQQYRVAEGKRLNDPDSCWLVLKDKDSGKSYYVNNAGVRRWHLPDMYQTETERQQEEEQLRFRKSRKEQRGDGDGDGDGAADDGESTQRPAAKEEDPLAGIVADYSARDQAALKAKPNREWDDLDKRRAVFKHAKATLTPLAARGDIEDDLFPTIVSTVCHEFFAENTKFGDSEKKKLAAAVLEYAQVRMDEKQVKEAYHKMNTELIEKVKRIDGERKAANARIIQLQNQEESMKQEIFTLRGHKQDALLASFQRMTRAGLIKTYWSRWKTFKGIVEAQLHVRARERRALDMKERNEELESEVAKLDAFVKQLQDRVQQAEGRDVIAMLLKQSGQQLIHRYFTNWRRYSLESVKEKQFYDAREQLANCPQCAMREVENSRIRARLHESFAAYRDATAALTEKEAQCVRLEALVDEKAQYAALQEAMAEEANKRAAELSRKVATFDGKMWESSIRQQSLEAEIERLQFEIMSLSDFSADPQGGVKNVPGFAANAVSRDGPGGGRGGGDGDPGRTLGDFFVAESEGGAAKLRTRLTARTAALSKAASSAAEAQQSVVVTAATMRDGVRTTSPSRGAVRARTEAALAPLVRAHVPDERDVPRFDPNNPGPPSEAPPSDVFYRQPLSSSDDSSLSSSSSAASSDDDVPPPPPDEDANAVCPRCGFRKKLTPFCPKDGTRHVFEDFNANTVGNDPLRALEPDRSEAAYTLAHRRTLKDKELAALPAGLPPPEYRATGAAGAATAARGPAAAGGGERSGSFADVARPAAAGSGFASGLRQSLNLDPTRYDPRSAVGTYAVPTPLEMDTADVRAVADHVRNTRMAVERRVNAQQSRGEPVALPSTYVPLSEFRQRAQQTELSSGIGMPVAAPQPASSRGKPSWAGVFDYSDGLSDAFGIGTGSAKDFGVYRGAEARELREETMVVPAQKMREQQHGTPSLRAPTQRH